ncbi:peptidylprolyl isomerase [Luteolibacter yonseiensis]|uniref:Peptidylprolyl isomerase n=1 Tax=Luteolibacter yonseiensis TaxID=1144680 RepID=A0A934VAQ5_9BACT|nr:peptidylprolyl isomerase [Luteolibacter yonseiensis]MBK1816443.1 peptidylprolyl isomerase [Luteolibacter yonseiensis]
MKVLPRLILLAAAGYLIADGFVFKGPVSRWAGSIISPASAPLAARVDGHPITISQLDRALAESLWLDGKTPASLKPEELKAARETALQELIDHELLRLQVKALAAQLPVTPEEINERLRRLVGRFETKGALETAMKTQGIPSEQDLRDRLAARIRQEKFLALRLAPSSRVTDEEAREWFERNQAAVALPERIDARHIFIPTLDHPPEEAKQKLDAALVELTEKKKDFATLARELSEDPATKENGGALGWMTASRLPEDFSVPAFSLEVNKPTLFRTKLGWHLVEVTARQPAGPRTFEQAKPEILNALAALKSRQATEEIRSSLRKSGSGKIEVF